LAIIVSRGTHDLSEEVIAETAPELGHAREPWSAHRSGFGSGLASQAKVNLFSPAALNDPAPTPNTDAGHAQCHGFLGKDALPGHPLIAAGQLPQFNL
jgi:hypothetical protein